MKKNRNINLDFIRALSMLCVIGLHTSPKPLAENRIFTTVFYMLLLTCNANFYMLSGQLNLRKTFCTRQDYRNFYLKRLLSILLPYVLFTFLLTLWNMLAAGEGITVLLYLKNVYTDFMTDNIQIHLWFMYPLIGMILSAPFLSKMLNNMEDWELNILFGIGIAWNVISIYLTQDFGVGFSYSAWLLSSWMLLFFAGYYCYRIIRQEKSRKKWYWAGLICLAVNLLLSCLFPDNYKFSNDLAPTYVLFAMSAFLFMQAELNIKNPLLQSVIRFLSKHSFTVYCIHFDVARWITPCVVRGTGATLLFIESFAVTFVVSLLFAVILDGCILKPMQKALTKLWKVA